MKKQIKKTEIHACFDVVKGKKMLILGSFGD